MRHHLTNPGRPGRYYCGRRIRPDDHWPRNAAGCTSCELALAATDDTTTTNQETTVTTKTKPVTTKPAARTLDDIRGALLQAEQEMNAAVLEREDPIRGMLLALLTRQHLLLLGPPGTAKSLLTDLAQQVVRGSERFSLLLTRTTLPDELFGMWDISAVKAGRMERISMGGTMRSAHVAFLDECFKANSTTLNSLLGALNERKFRNGTQGEVQLPLVSCVGASNEYPQGDDLGALYDRFILRYWISALGEEGNWLELMLGGARPSITAGVTLEELERAQAAVAAVTIPQELGGTLLQIRSALGRRGISRSDRRWRQAMAVLRAQAWLSGRDTVERDDCLALQAVLWDDFEGEGRAVQECLLDTCAPRLKELLDVLDLAAEQLRLLRDYSHRQDVTRGEVSEAKGKFSELADRARQLAPDAGPRGARELERLASMEEEAARLHAASMW